MLADLDTKYTDLAIRPRLPSVGPGAVLPPFGKLAYWHQIDRELVNRAVRDSGSRRRGSIRRHIRPVNVHEFTGFEVARLVAA